MSFEPSIFTSVINSYLPEPHASLLNGILFGESLKASKALYEQLKIVGLLHLVVLSGINITILGAIVCAFTVQLGKKASVSITIGVIVLFILFVGADPPIIRAGFMGTLAMIAILLGRKNIALYALFLSVLFIAIFWPRWLGTISFQLSFGATLGIILFGKGSTRRPKTRLQWVKKELWKDLKPSLAAQAFTAPLIFLYFKQVSLIAPLANLLVAGAIAPLMLAGLATAILGKIHYALGLLPSYVAFAFLNYIVFVVETLSRVPFIFFDLSGS